MVKIFVRKFLPDSIALAVSSLNGVLSMMTTAGSSLPSNRPSTHIIFVRELSFRTLMFLD